jgi:hypothetical protein
VSHHIHGFLWTLTGDQSAVNAVCVHGLLVYGNLPFTFTAPPVILAIGKNLEHVLASCHKNPIQTPMAKATRLRWVDGCAIRSVYGALRTTREETNHKQKRLQCIRLQGSAYMRLQPPNAVIQYSAQCFHSYINVESSYIDIVFCRSMIRNNTFLAPFTNNQNSMPGSPLALATPSRKRLAGYKFCCCCSGRRHRRASPREAQGRLA